MCDYDEYCQWLGFEEGQFVAYDGAQEEQPEEKPVQPPREKPNAQKPAAKKELKNT